MTDSTATTADQSSDQSPQQGQATAVAHPNLALIKYWGKRDDERILPYTGSLSLTLDIFPTRTTVTVDPQAQVDTFRLNGEEVDGVPRERVVRFLEQIREQAGRAEYAVVNSENEVPTGAGLASSAAGFAALACAGAAAYGLELDSRELSRLARRGSGSACRSIESDLVIWHDGAAAGDLDAQDKASYAERVPGPRLAMVIAVVSAEQKAVSSRVAMKDSIATSPFFDGWVSSTKQDLQQMRQALADGDYTHVGQLTESNALRMHATINGNRPVVRYLTPTSIAIFDELERLRADGLEVYGTADAGPNVAVLCRDEDLDRTTDALRKAFPELTLFAAHSGPGAHVVH